MFHHVKELQFNARVSRPDPRFAALLLEQFGGGNGELKAAMQYFVQAFSVRQPYPDKYDLLMDIATEEFSHLEIVGALARLDLGEDLLGSRHRRRLQRLRPHHPRTRRPFHASTVVGGSPTPMNSYCGKRPAMRICRSFAVSFSTITFHFFTYY